MDHLPFRTDPQRKIKTGVQLAAGAFASGFAANSGHGDQGTDEERFFVKEFSQAGAGLAFFWGKVGTVTHGDLLSYSDIYYYIRIKAKLSIFFECEFAQNRELAGFGRFYKGL
jgi:hypothetical protein